MRIYFWLTFVRIPIKDAHRGALLLFEHRGRPRVTGKCEDTQKAAGADARRGV